MNTIYVYQTVDDSPARFRKLYEHVMADLESVLLFLKTIFNSYFNKKGKVPKPLQINFEISFSARLMAVKNRLGTQFDGSVFKILEPYSDPYAECLSYLQVDYLDQLLSVLSSWNRPITTDSKLPPLFELLIAQKFNNEGFLRLVFNTVKDQLSSVESEEEKILFVRKLYKHISQIQGPVDAFIIESNSAKEIIMDWLLQEADYWEFCLPKKEVNSSNSHI